MTGRESTFKKRKKYSALRFLLQLHNKPYEDTETPGPFNRIK